MPGRTTATKKKKKKKARRLGSLVEVSKQVASNNKITKTQARKKKKQRPLCFRILDASRACKTTELTLQARGDDKRNTMQAKRANIVSPLGVFFFFVDSLPALLFFFFVARGVGLVVFDRQTKQKSPIATLPYLRSSDGVAHGLQDVVRRRHRGTED